VTLVHRVAADGFQAAAETDERGRPGYATDVFTTRRR
jgi:hypothetical protein